MPTLLPPAMTQDGRNIDSDGDHTKVVPPYLKEMIKMCLIVEENGIVVRTEGALEVVKSSRRY